MSLMRLKQKWNFALVLGITLGSIATGTTPSFANVIAVGLENRLSIPKDSDVPTSYGLSTQTSLPEVMTVFVWNLYKGQKDTWSTDFNQLVRTADLFLTQESVDSKTVLSEFESSELSWNMATSFIMSGNIRTGVATGARVDSLWGDWSRSHYLEPITNTPKMSVYSKYPMATGETLLVVNVHGVLANFNLVDSLQEQLDQAGKQVQSHTGPVLVAGDFNTWMKPRLKALKRWAVNMGLHHAEFLDDPRPNPLDHVLTRGLTVEAGRVMKEVKGSDHLPLVVQLKSEHSIAN